MSYIVGAALVAVFDNGSIVKPPRRCAALRPANIEIQVLGALGSVRKQAIPWLACSTLLGVALALPRLLTLECLFQKLRLLARLTNKKVRLSAPQTR